jgi:deoxyribose-phosphate aldolase
MVKPCQSRAGVPSFAGISAGAAQVTTQDKTSAAGLVRPKLPLVHEARNAGTELDLDWVAAVQAITSAIERRAATLPGRRSVQRAFQAAWLL